MKKGMTIVVICALIWIVDAKPWRSETKTTDVRTEYGTSKSYVSDTKNGSYDCPRCNGSKECRVCDGKGTYYNNITGETKSCGVCKKNPGVCQTCEGNGTVTASTYEQVLANESKIAAKNYNSNSSSEHEEIEFCLACKSTGRCKICDGNGVYTNGFDISQKLPCTACTKGSVDNVGKCQICGGDGILYN